MLNAIIVANRVVKTSKYSFSDIGILKFNFSFLFLIISHWHSEFTVFVTRTKWWWPAFSYRSIRWSRGHCMVHRNGSSRPISDWTTRMAWFSYRGQDRMKLACFKVKCGRRCFHCWRRAKALVEVFLKNVITLLSTWFEQGQNRTR